MKNQKNSKLKRNSRKISKINPQKIFKNLKKNLKIDSKYSSIFIFWSSIIFIL